MITLVIVLVLLGVGLYLIETYVPMAPPMILIIRVVVILFSVLLILGTFGIINMPAIR